MVGPSPRKQVDGPSLLFYCCDEILAPRQLLKENIEFGHHGCRGLECMTAMVGSMAGGRQIWYCALTFLTTGRRQRELTGPGVGF